MNLQGVTHLVLANNAQVTSAGVTGGWTDLIGLIGPGKRNIKAILTVANGTTAGTMGSTLQTAEDTAGTGAATLITFTSFATNGDEAKHAMPAANHRYARYLNSGTAAAHDMLATCILLAEARVKP